MGRTKRKRSRIFTQTKNTNLDPDQSTVNLRKWLNQNHCINPIKLQLRSFKYTGRGVTSKNPVRENDVLLQIPMSCLITYKTIEESGMHKTLSNEAKVTMQTLLAFFLAIEKHKGVKSLWKSYVDTLPNPEPCLPWMCSTDELKYFPEDLQSIAKRLRSAFTQSFLNLKESIPPTAFCHCCKKPLHRVLETNLFRWAYVLVNTRAVYVDPQTVFSMNKSSCIISILSDEPSMALCPFLDMFNHHYLARTEAKVVFDQGRRFYELRTLTEYKKYEQFFISYGAHDNEKLLMEYGFYIDGNSFDCVKFGFREVFEILKMSLDDRQYKFIRKHGFDVKDIYVNHSGASFNLKAILFIGFRGDILNYHSYIFSDCYPSDFNELLDGYVDILLNIKLNSIKCNLQRLMDNGKNEKNREWHNVMEGYLLYRVQYVQNVLNKPR